jgi:hypothetical protein
MDLQKNKIKEIEVKPINKLVQTSSAYRYKDIEIPKGFKSNGATLYYIFYSIIGLALFNPNFLWLLVVALFTLRTPFHPKHLTASIVHDYLCSQEDYIKADKYFLEILLKTDDPMRAYIKYIGVILWHKMTLKY